MNGLLPLRVYLSSDGSYGVVHVHYKGADIIARDLSYHEVHQVIEQAMLSYPTGTSIDTFQVKKDVEAITSTLGAEQFSF
jgi:hypothetical protein